MEKRFGYVQVSSAEQNEARQLEALTAHGIAAEDITTDKLSGKNMDRPGLAALLEKVRAGDIVTVTSIDRLGRNTKDVLSIVEQLDSKGANLVCLQQKLDTSTPIGKCVLTILASFAEMERANIRQRQAEGIAIAKREGRFKGRGKKTERIGNDLYQVEAKRYYRQPGGQAAGHIQVNLLSPHEVA